MNDLLRLSDEPRRRQWMTEPWEPLLAPIAPMVVISRVLEFVRDTGVAPACLSMSRVGAVPGPAPESPGGGPRAFEGLRAAHAWNPLFWLPEHLTRRVMVQDAGGTARSETDDEWVTRVLLGLELGGVYTPEGGWFDLLAENGIDVDDPEDAGRVERWLAGQQDELLSGLSLEPHLQGADYLDWAVAMSGALIDKSLPVAWALSAENLLDLIDAAIADGLDLRPACHQVASLAHFAFRDNPAETGIFGMLAADPDAIVDPSRTLNALRDDIEKIHASCRDSVPKEPGVATTRS